MAERIIALAREHGVPIHDDAGLAEALARLQLEAQVPEELWKAVAEALVWAYRLTARALVRAPSGAARACGTALRLQHHRGEGALRRARPGQPHSAEPR